MGLPNHPVSLTAEQIAELNRKLSSLRHDVNNHLALILAALELMRQKPEMTERLVATLAEQPAKITAAVARFSGEFEAALAITRP